MIMDLRFCSEVLVFHFDQSKEAHAEVRPRSAVVQWASPRDSQCDKLVSPRAGGPVDAAKCTVYDLHEYSLSFHLPDLRHLLEDFGPYGVLARLAACPNMLHQRLLPQELGWT